MGGASTYVGGLAELASTAWLDRDTLLLGDEEAAGWVYQICRVMRSSDAGNETDVGPGHSNYPSQSLSFISGRYLYEACKR